MRWDVFAASVFLVSCTTMSAQIEAALSDPNSTAIIFEIRESGFVCGDQGALMRLRRISDGAVVYVSSSRGLFDNDAPLRLQPIKPGVWQPEEMQCAHRLTLAHGSESTLTAIELSSTGVFPLEPRFGSFEVRPGQIVYPGTFEAFDPATRLFARQYASGDGHFRLFDDSERQRTKLIEHHPEWEERWVVSLAQPDDARVPGDN